MLALESRHPTAQRQHDAGRDRQSAEQYARQQRDEECDPKGRRDLARTEVDDGGLAIERAHDRAQRDAGDGNQQSDHVHDGLQTHFVVIHVA